MKTSRSASRRFCGVAGPLAGLALILGFPSAGSAQLRPLSPLDWYAIDAMRPISIGVGLGTLQNQPASLAGTQGDLLELGRFHLVWWSGRMGIEAEGTLYRRFEDEVVLRPPAPGTDPVSGSARTDAGDVVASTVIRLSQPLSRFTAALRFSTRLPTTSDEPGLERDRTDFFATLAGRYRWGRVSVGGESGVGILGTRVDGVDQLDVLTFAAFVDYRMGPVTAIGTIVGQDDVHLGATRGNEDLSEVRIGVRAGDRVWVAATAVRGIARFSPGGGLLLMMGIRR